MIVCRFDRVALLAAVRRHAAARLLPPRRVHCGECGLSNRVLSGQTLYHVCGASNRIKVIDNIPGVPL